MFTSIGEIGKLSDVFFYLKNVKVFCDLYP